MEVGLLPDIGVERESVDIAARVRAAAVYSGFKVAAASGVLAPRLHAERQVTSVTIRKRCLWSSFILPPSTSLQHIIFFPMVDVVLVQKVP